MDSDKTPERPGSPSQFIYSPNKKAHSSETVIPTPTPMSFTRIDGAQFDRYPRDPFPSQHAMFQPIDWHVAASHREEDIPMSPRSGVRRLHGDVDTPQGTSRHGRSASPVTGLNPCLDEGLVSQGWQPVASSVPSAAPNTHFLNDLTLAQPSPIRHHSPPTWLNSSLPPSPTRPGSPNYHAPLSPLSAAVAKAVHDTCLAATAGYIRAHAADGLGLLGSPFEQKGKANYCNTTTGRCRRTRSRRRRRQTPYARGLSTTDRPAPAAAIPPLPTGSTLTHDQLDLGPPPRPANPVPSSRSFTFSFSFRVPCPSALATPQSNNIDDGNYNNNNNPPLPFGNVDGDGDDEDEDDESGMRAATTGSLLQNASTVCVILWLRQQQRQQQHQSDDVLGEAMSTVLRWAGTVAEGYRRAEGGCDCCRGDHEDGADDEDEDKGDEGGGGLRDVVEAGRLLCEFLGDADSVVEMGRVERTMDGGGLPRH